MPNAYALRDAARRIVEYMRLGASLDEHGYSADAIVTPNADVRRLCAHLAAVAPSCITVRDESPSNVMHIVIDDDGEGLGADLCIHNPAPSCYRHRDGVTDTREGRRAAGRELLRLAAGEEPDLARARERHVPHPSIPTDGEERVA